MDPIKFCSPIIPDMSEVSDMLEDSFKSGHLSNFGVLYERAVESLKLNLNIPYRDVVLTSSGHTSLMTALSVLGVRSVVVPDYTFVSTAISASLQGINVIISDVDLKTGSLSVNELKKISEPYDAVIVVCPLSTIPDLSIISSFCKKNNKKLIIDGAATFGSSDFIFSYGDAYCMSFHATKTLPVGECGAVLLNKGLEEKAKSYINFGFDKNKNISIEGINAKVSEYTCAVLLSLLNNSEGFIKSRIKIGEMYREVFGDLVLPSFAEKTAYASFPVYFKTEDKRDKIFSALKEKEIQVLKYYIPIKKLKNSNYLYKHNICLPCHHNLTQRNIKRIIDTILYYV